MKIRQEINILSGETLTSTGAVAALSTGVLNTNEYHGTVKYFFEFIVNGGAGNKGVVRLTRKGTSTYDSVVYGNHTTVHNLFRVEFTPPVGTTQYVVELAGDGSVSQNLIAAKIIVVQDKSVNLYDQSVFEIGNYETSKTNTTAAVLTNPKYWKYNASDWAGSEIAFYFMACMKNTSVETINNYTASTTWATPAGTVSAIVECWGAGGGGGGVNGNPAAGGGGAGGAYARKTITSPSGNYTVTVGTGGTAGSGGNGGTGNPSWFGSTGTVYAPGGAGGSGGTANSTNYNGATGSSTGAIGDTVNAGGSGSNGNYTSGGGAGGGAAGFSAAGGNASGSTGGTGNSGIAGNAGTGANGVASSTAGATGGTYGGGASGGRANSNTNRAGGAGRAGYVRVTSTKSATCYALLQQSDGTGDGFTGWTTVATLSTTEYADSTVLISSAFTPVDGRNYRVATYTSDGTVSYTIYNACIKVVNKFTVGTGFSDTASATSDASNIYFGRNSNVVRRFVKSSFPTVNATKSGLSGNVISLTVDDTYLYCGHYTSPGIVSRILLSDFTTTNTVTFSAGEGYIYGLTNDASYVYACGTGWASSIKRIHKSDWTTVDSCSLSGFTAGFTCITDDDTYVYAVSASAPSKIARIQKSDFSTYTTLTLDTGQDSVWRVYNDANYIYAVCDINPGKVVRINKSDFSTKTEIALQTGENRPLGCAITNDYLHLGTYTTPAWLISIRLSDFTVVGRRQLTFVDANTIAAAYGATADEYNFYVGSLTSGIIIKTAAVEPRTKLSSEYLIGNTLVTAGTGLKNLTTRWDSNEWEGFDIQTAYALDAANGSTSKAVARFGAYGGDTSSGVVRQQSDTRGIKFSSDGTKMYSSTLNNGTIYYWTLSTPWYPATATYGGSVDLSAQNSNIIHFTFSTDGTKLYTHEYSANDVHEYDLSTAWDVTTASFVQTKNFAANPAGGANSIHFKPDGTKFYIGGFSAGVIYQYSVSPAWDISSASYDSVSFTLSGATPASWMMNNSGTKIWYTIDDGGGAFYRLLQTTFATPYDLSTGTNNGTLGYPGKRQKIYGVTAGPTDDVIFCSYDYGQVSRIELGETDNNITMNNIQDSVVASPDNRGSNVITLPTTGNTSPYILDTYTGSKVAYSLRKLRSAQTNCIRVRRSSDNSEQDIGFSGEHLDTASLLSFVGTGGTDVGYIVTWYDQSGNSINASMATAGNQPVIVDNGVLVTNSGRPAIVFLYSAANRYLDIAATGSWVGVNGQWQAFAAGHTIYSGSVNRIGFSVDDNGSNRIFQSFVANTNSYMSLWSGAGGTYSYWIGNPNTLSSNFIMHSMRDRMYGIFRLNDFETGLYGYTADGPVPGTDRAARIGEWSSSTGNPWIGFFSEIIHWADASWTRTRNITDNMNYYWNGFGNIRDNIITNNNDIYSSKIIVTASKKGSPRSFGFLNGC